MRMSVWGHMGKHYTPKLCFRSVEAVQCRALPGTQEDKCVCVLHAVFAIVGNIDGAKTSLEKPAELALEKALSYAYRFFTLCLLNFTTVSVRYILLSAWIVSCKIS